MSKNPKDTTSEKWNKKKERDFEVSSTIVNKMWSNLSHTQGILLTQIEAVLGDSLQAKAFKSLIRRELNILGGRIQNITYEEWRVQAVGDGETEEPPMNLPPEDETVNILE